MSDLNCFDAQSIQVIFFFVVERHPDETSFFFSYTSEIVQIVRVGKITLFWLSYQRSMPIALFVLFFVVVLK